MRRRRFATLSTSALTTAMLAISGACTLGARGASSDRRRDDRAGATGSDAAQELSQALAGHLATLESRAEGRLGVGMWIEGQRPIVGHRIDERFGMCSSFKLALAAFILRRADAGELKLDERVQLNRADLVPHAPVTGPRIESGDPMSWEELAAAAQITSDNVAANVLLRRLGGPEAFTAMARELGDEQTRVDRYEPECNAVWPDDPRDTTTPAAYAGLTAALVHGDVLGPGSRAKLQRWMIETQTGQMRLRAGLPKSWRSGDKTGTMNGADYINRVNDVAVAWPEGGPRLVVSCYYESPVRIDEIRDVDQAVLAQVGSLAATYYEDLLSVSR